MKLPSVRSLKPSKTVGVLLVAITFGLLAAFVASSYLSSRLREIESRSRGEMVSVVVAKKDLQAGVLLTTETLAVREVPGDYAHSLAISPDQFASIEGQELAFNMKGGEALLWPMLEGRKVPTFSVRVAPGRRAITVAVDEINSISGLLEPGDLIDLLVTFQQERQKVTAPLLQGVRVLATGQRAVDESRNGETRIYSTVTLDTDWKQAQNVVIAREEGRLTALLRNPEDTQPLPEPLVDLAALIEQRRRGDVLAPGVREVPVLYGGSNSSIPAQALWLGAYMPPASADRQAAAAQTSAAVSALMNAARPLSAADGTNALAEDGGPDVRTVMTSANAASRP